MPRDDTRVPWRLFDGALVLLVAVLGWALTGLSSAQERFDDRLHRAVDLQNQTAVLLAGVQKQQEALAKDLERIRLESDEHEKLDRQREQLLREEIRQGKR